MGRRDSEKLKRTMHNQRLSATQIGKAKAKRRMDIATILVVVFLVVVVCAAAVIIVKYSKPAPMVTKLEYDQIREGMPYEQVCAIIGDPGEEVSGQIYGLYEDTFFGAESEDSDSPRGKLTAMIAQKSAAQRTLREASLKTQVPNSLVGAPEQPAEEASDQTILYRWVNEDGSGLLLALDPGMVVKRKSTLDILKTPEVFFITDMQG